MTEKNIQILIFNWAIANINNYPQLEMLRSTQNGLYIKNKKNIAIAKMAGMRNGVPDIYLPVANNKYHSLWVELKTLTPLGKESKEQKKEIELLNKYGNYACFCYGYDATIKTIENYLNNNL
jgi:hypothetical protein